MIESVLLSNSSNLLICSHNDTFVPGLIQKWFLYNCYAIDLSIIVCMFFWLWLNEYYESWILLHVYTIVTNSYRGLVSNDLLALLNIIKWGRSIDPFNLWGILQELILLKYESPYVSLSSSYYSKASINVVAVIVARKPNTGFVQ